MNRTRSRPQPLPRTSALADHPIPTKGNLLLRTLAMPADTNPNGDIFGGWIMSQMDIAGGILAKETARSRVVTVAVDSIKFLKPVEVGNVICCYGRVVRIGTTSIAIELEVWVKQVRRETEEEWPRFKVTEALFTYVAIDGKGRKRAIKVADKAKRGRDAPWGRVDTVEPHWGARARRGGTRRLAGIRDHVVEHDRTLQGRDVEVRKGAPENRWHTVARGNSGSGRSGWRRSRGESGRRPARG